MTHPTLETQIREIVNNYDGSDNLDYTIRRLLSLIRSLVPESIDEEHHNEINKDDPDEHGKWWSKGWNSGYNSCRQHILTKIEGGI